MEGTAIAGPAFWSSRRGRVFAPPHLEREGAEIAKRLGNSGAVVFASSGSGGGAKWTRLSREALLASAEAVNAHLEADASDCWMLALPIFHVGGFGVAARAHAAGCGLKQFAGRWSAERFGDALGAAGATLTSLVPTQVHDLVAGAVRAPQSLRAVVVGGATLDEATGEGARRLGWPVLQSYGMTETASQVATAALSDLEGEFHAAPLPVLRCWEHRIGADGCLQLRGAPLFESYLHLEEGLLRDERPHDEAGWFATADRVEPSGAGVTMLGRADRQVKILGELVNVEGVEAELRERLPRGVGVYLLALADERRGWRLVPVVEGDETDLAEVVETLNSDLPGFSRLEAPRFLPELPRTALGKIDAGRLREEVGRRGR